MTMVFRARPVASRVARMRHLVVDVAHQGMVVKHHAPPGRTVKAGDFRPDLLVGAYRRQRQVAVGEQVDEAARRVDWRVRRVEAGDSQERRVADSLQKAQVSAATKALWVRSSSASNR